jgi:hypothetical protein
MKYQLLLATLALGGVIRPAWSAENGVYVETRNMTPEVLSSVPEANAPSAFEGDEVPSPSQRDRLFAEAGLNEEISKLDQLDRDLLIYRARRLPLDQLVRKYPKIKRQKLAQLTKVLNPTTQER